MKGLSETDLLSKFSLTTSRYFRQTINSLRASKNSSILSKKTIEEFIFKNFFNFRKVKFIGQEVTEKRVSSKPHFPKSFKQSYFQKQEKSHEYSSNHARFRLYINNLSPLLTNYQQTKIAHRKEIVRRGPKK